MHFFSRLMCIAALAGLCTHAQSQDVYTVRTKDIKAAIPPTLWGLFFEDINRAADGVVYAEMVENRSFDFPKPMTTWETWPPSRLRDGIFLITNQAAENAADPKFMTVTLQPGDTVGLINSGFDEGMAFKKDLSYHLMLRIRSLQPGIHIRAFLINSHNRPIARTEIQPGDPIADGIGQWQDQTITLTPTDSSTGGKLLVLFEGAGKLDLDRVSLFPTDTWKNRPGGLRADLVKDLADLHPGFLRRYSSRGNEESRGGARRGL